MAFAAPRELLTDWVGRRITTKGVGLYCPGCAEDITTNYKTPETTIDPRDEQEVEIAASDDSQLGMPVHADVIVRNLDGVPHDYTCYSHLRAIAQNGEQLGMVAGPVTIPLTILGGEVAEVPFDVPWILVAPWMGATTSIEFDAVVTRTDDQRIWLKQRLVDLRGLPVEIATQPDDRVMLGTTASATMTCSNPLPAPLINARLVLQTDLGLLIGGLGTSETINLGTIDPGDSRVIERSLTAAATGHHGLAARLFADGVVPGQAFAPLEVVECRADFNSDGFLDFFDADAYVLCFEGTECPPGASADFNGDGFLDFFDLDEFVVAFEAGC